MGHRVLRRRKQAGRPGGSREAEEEEEAGSVELSDYHEEAERRWRLGLPGIQGVLGGGWKENPR